MLGSAGVSDSRLASKDDAFTSNIVFRISCKSAKPKSHVKLFRVYRGEGGERGAGVSDSRPGSEDDAFTRSKNWQRTNKGENGGLHQFGPK